MDLSRPFDSSVNDYINREDYSLDFCSVDDAIHNLITLGKGALMTKLDIKHAFRLVPVEERRTGISLVISLKIATILTLYCILSLRSAPYLFCLISGAAGMDFCRL